MSNLLYRVGEMRFSLLRALFGLVAAVLLVGLVPAGVVLDVRVVRALEERARGDLESGVLVVQDRFSGQADARMMHAKEIAGNPSLIAALVRGDSAEAAVAAARLTAEFVGEQPLVISSGGEAWAGPEVPSELIKSTRNGNMPVEVVPHGAGLATIAIAPVEDQGRWVGAAGTWAPLGDNEAARISALTRSDVLVSTAGGALVSYTGAAEPAMGLVALLAERPAGAGVEELSWQGKHYFLASAIIPGNVRITLVRPGEDFMALVPVLRLSVAAALSLGLLLALLVGAAFARALARPVGDLSTAAARVAGGDLRAPIPRSNVTELNDMAVSFEAMRDALAGRIDELASAASALEERQARLGTLQAELIQRDRVSATARLLVQLAHEIRNPVAGVRNALELLRRRVQKDAEAREFADMAIEDLLRMHEMAERMLDLHRPRDTEGTCDASQVVRDVVALARLDPASDHGLAIEAVVPPTAEVQMPPEQLKQLLLNLIRNAVEAGGRDASVVVRVEIGSGKVRIVVDDDGPGIPPGDLRRVFDAFFTTKADTRGVGLGLYIAEGLVRARGGRIFAENKSAGGARFTIELAEAPTPAVKMGVLA